MLTNAKRVLGGALIWAALAISAQAAPAHDIRIDDVAVYPESIGAAPDGTLYAGSMKGIVFRARPGERFAEPFIQPDARNGILSLLGVLPDARRRTLWLCSSPSPLRNPPAVGTTSLMAFDLKTGAFKASYPFAAPGGACNDITIGPDGAVYATDTPNGRIFVLKPHARALELYAADAQLKGIDGIVFGGNGKLYLNIVSKGLLMRVDRDPKGAFAGLTTLKLSQPVAGPDGFRLISGSRFILAEGNSGRIDEVTIKGDDATIRVLKDGLVSPPAVTVVGRTGYAAEGKIVYLIDPKLKGQDPGPFIIRAIPLP